MIFSRFTAGLGWRAAVLFATLTTLAWMLAYTQWYVAIGLCVLATLAELAHFARYATASDRELARFLDAVAFDDTSQNFSGRRNAASADLGAAMARVLDRLRQSHSEREEQARYAQTILAHVPVALIELDMQDRVEQLNTAARRLFDGPIHDAAEFARFGEAFAVGMAELKPGTSTVLRMERKSGVLQLKAAATAFAVSGKKRRLISLQNIESELNAQELSAWQSVIRVMTHEVMNSLTPISSLSETAHGLVRQAADALPPDSPLGPSLTDASEALETVARRSEGLLHFVQNHRRVTRRLVAKTEILPVRRIFARLERLFSADLAAHDIALMVKIEPETLEIAADGELMEQALINLLRNAIEALRDGPDRQIWLLARLDAQGRTALSVADNGPGVDLAQRDRIFIPFFTTKQHGSGVGLTLVRQIAILHGGSVDVSDTPGGGATVQIVV